MKVTRILAMLMVIAISISLFVIPTTAAEATDVAEPHNHSHIEFIFADDTLSEEFKEKAIAHLLGEEEDGADTYGLTCDLFGHKTESTQISKITHKAKAAAPRCLKQTYDYYQCTRCGYNYSALISSVYIYCC